MSVTTVWTKPAQIEEADALLLRALDEVLAIARGLSQPWKLRHLVGDLQAASVANIVSGALGPNVAVIWALARQSGATFGAFDSLRRKLIAETPKYVPGQAVAHLLTRMTLIQMAMITSQTDYVSREDATAALDTISAAFEAAEEDAVDEQDAAAYCSLVALRGATVRDLASRALRLPFVINYEFADSFPALWISNRLYADGSRAEELLDENKWVHPAFPPLTGKYLSPQ